MSLYVVFILIPLCPKASFKLSPGPIVKTLICALLGIDFCPKAKVFKPSRINNKYSFLL